MAVIYSQVTEVKLNDVWLWPNQCKDMKKYNLFIQWILIMGERRRFPIPMQTLQCICNSQFPFKSMQIIKYQWNFSKCPFQNFKALKFYNFDFRCLQQKQKQKTWKKTNGSLSKKNFDNKEKKIKSSIPNNQWKPQPKLSMIVRTQRKPRSLLIQMKIVLLKQQSTKKHQTLNFQSITDL
jgi:hypothetical protein